MTYKVRKIFYQLHLAKTDPRSSRTVSLLQLSFLLEISRRQLFAIMSQLELDFVL